MRKGKRFSGKSVSEEKRKLQSFTDDGQIQSKTASNKKRKEKENQLDKGQRQRLRSPAPSAAQPPQPLERSL